MDKYIGVKLIEAEPMREHVFYKEKNGSYPDGDYGDREGYKVGYPDGYKSWSPKDVFEKAYLKVTPNPKLKTNCSISKQMVDDFIKDIEVITMGAKNTVVRAILVNGFEIVESSACVDPANYDEQIGKEICLEKIKDKIWFLLGFLLQTGVGGVR